MARAKRPASANQLPIASAVRARRHRLGLTLQELARKSGLSAPFLSQVERGQTTPSITSLIAIAQALQVDIHYFINPPPSSQVVRRAKEPELLETATPIRYVRLSGGHPERQMEALLMSIPPGSTAPSTAREGEGFYYVLEGELKMTLGKETFVLGPGDSAHFDQRHSFQMANSGKRILRMLWVGTPAIF
ncbi:MAG TPA: XRE family transcriptional regulator [Steroidobacteraceae bacterium]|jgi:transcriptional regulator with XRE-family HTH domain|nr:XRE family transcriptional regulator [Steroidobacteraceae bacterium]